MRPLLLLPLLLSTLLLSACSSTPTADFFVSPTGNDACSGRLPAPAADKKDGPFATLDRARLAVRQLKAAQPDRKEPITVLIRGGAYFLDQPLTFEPEDSGSVNCPIVYAAYPGETPVISGGVLLRDLFATPHGRWQTRLSDVAAGNWQFSQLFVGGQRRFRPRLPQNGYFFVAAESTPSPKATGKGIDRFRFAQGALDPDWKNLSDVELMTFHPWWAGQWRIAGIDAATQTVTLTGQSDSTQGYTKFHPGQRFLVDNVAEAFGTPGQWYLDRKTGVLTYTPLPGETLANSPVIAPRLTTLLRLAGDPGAGRFVDEIEFRGLTFAHANWTVPADSYVSVQACTTMPGAVVATGARGCAFVDCTVTQVGGYAMELGAGCRGNRLENCELTDLGGGGLKLGTTSYHPADHPQHASGTTVRNCLIAHGGRLNPGAIGIWIGQSSDNRIEHNEICDFYYSGMSIGWTWGYGNAAAQRNLVEYNHIHHLGFGVLGDMGGIYTLGNHEGSKLRFNRIHDVVCIGYGGWGIYFDEGTTRMLAENNLVYRCTDGNFHQHYGKENTVRNNIFAHATDNQIALSRKEPHVGVIFTSNIVAWDSGILFRGDPDNFTITMDQNLYWREGTPFKFGKNTFEEWQKKGRDTKSLIADPQFADPKADDFTLPADHPALKQIGFVPFDVSTAGRLTAPPHDYPSPRWPAIYPGKPAPQPVADDFELSPIGAKAGLAHTHEENSSAVIRVTDETAASGRRSLKFTDGPGQQFGFNPHLYYTPGFRSGTLRGSFALRYEGGTTCDHQWRTGGHPYQVGPSLRIDTTGQLLADGKPIAKLPLKQWVRFEITAAIGAKADGKWDLTLTLPNQPPLKLTGLSCSKEFDHLGWLGWTAEGHAPGVFYLDDVKLEVR